MQMSQIVFKRAVKTKKKKNKNNGGEQHRSVNDTVQIDGQGYGIVTEVIFRGFATLYMIWILDSSFEVGSTKCV